MEKGEEGGGGKTERAGRQGKRRWPCGHQEGRQERDRDADAGAGCGDAQGARTGFPGCGKARRPAADRRIPQGDEGRDQLTRLTWDAAGFFKLLAGANESFSVMPGLVPGIHVLFRLAARKTWMARTSPP